MTSEPRKSSFGVTLIGYFKLISSVMLVGLGVGIFKQIGGDPAAEIGQLVGALKLDSENKYIHSVLSGVSGLTTKQLYALSAGTFVYAFLYAIEGIGLVLNRRWGEYFTVFITGSLIPFEAYEVIRKLTVLRSVILALNVAIVVYLIVQLKRSIHGESESKPNPD